MEQFGKIISFKSFEEAKDIILHDIQGYIDFNREEIDEYEIADEWTAIVNGIREKGISAYESDIRGYITDSFDAVCGMPRRYLGEDGVQFFNAVCEYYDPSA